MDLPQRLRAPVARRPPGDSILGGDQLRVHLGQRERELPCNPQTAFCVGPRAIGTWTCIPRSPGRFA